MTVPIVVVTGPPCSGKSTHIAQQRGPRDVVVDLDALAFALGYPARHLDWSERPAHPARAAAVAARAALVKLALAGGVSAGVTTWIVDTQPSPEALARYRRTGARVVALDPGREECRRRAVADGRSAATLEQIDQWYAAAATPIGSRW